MNRRLVAILASGLAFVARADVARGQEAVTEVSAEEPASPDVDENAGEDTLEVVVTGTRTTKRASDAPVRTLVVDRAIIETRQSRSLADSFQYLPGVRVENNCQNCGFTQLRLNGLDGPYTQVLIDGLPSYSPLTGVYGLEQLPTEMIDRLEIVKGGGSSLYGPGAIAGVVNLITRRPEYDYATMLVQREGVGMRTPGTRATANGGVVTDDGRHGFHGYAAVYQREGHDRDGDGFTELVRLRSVGGGGTLYLTLAKGAEVQLGMSGLIENRRGGDSLDLPPHDAELAEQIDTRRLQGDFRLRHEVSRHVDYQVGYALAHTQRDTYYGGGGQSSLATLNELGPPRPDWDDVQFARYEEALAARQVALGAYGVTENTLQVGDGHVNLSYAALGEQVLTFGVQAQADRVDDRYLGYDRVIEDTFGFVGGYLQHDWVFSSWGEAVLGLRVDQHTELAAPVASPRAALMFRPVDALRLRSSFSTGFRAPQAFDEDLHIESVAGAPRIIRNDPDLDPEYGMSFAQQIEVTFEPVEGTQVKAALNGYYQRLTDAFVLDTEDDPSTPELEVVRVNRGLTQVYGGEATAFLSYRDLAAFRGGFTLENAFNAEPDPDFGQTRIFRTPRAYGFAELLMTHGGLTVQTGVDITGPMMVPHYDADGAPRVDEIGDLTPWFADLAVNVAYRVALPGYFLEPFAGVQNLFDAFQNDFDRGPTRDVGYIYGPRLPRTVRVGMKAGL